MIADWKFKITMRVNAEIQSILDSWAMMQAPIAQAGQWYPQCGHYEDGRCVLAWRLASILPGCTVRVMAFNLEVNPPLRYGGGERVIRIALNHGVRRWVMAVGTPKGMAHSKFSSCEARVMEVAHTARNTKKGGR